MSRNNGSGGSTKVGDFDYSHRGHTRGAQTGMQTGAIFGDVTQTLDGVYDTAKGAAGEALDTVQFAVDPFGIGNAAAGTVADTADDAYNAVEDIFGARDGNDSDQSSGSDSSGEDSRDFDRNGTTTTDGDDQNGSDNGDGQNQGSGGMKKLALYGGAAAVGIFAITKMSDSDSSRSVPSTGRTTAREKGASSRSNRGKSEKSKGRGKRGSV